MDWMLVTSNSIAALGYQYFGKAGIPMTRDTIRINAVQSASLYPMKRTAKKKYQNNNTTPPYAILWITDFTV